MADSPFLHIRSPDLGQPPRVLQLDRSTLRVGHGPRCDLALADPALAEVHCILRRRGDDWTVQPIGPAGLMTIDGRAVETVLRLPAGATLRIGQFTLRLVDPRPASRFGAYATAPAVVPEPDLPAEVLPLAASPLATPVSRSVPPSAPHVPPVASERERLARWQARPTQRPDLSRRDERLREWTARWEAVGRDLRARAVTRPAPDPLIPPSASAVPSIPTPAPHAPVEPLAPPMVPLQLALPAPSPVLPEAVVVPEPPVSPDSERPEMTSDFRGGRPTPVEAGPTTAPEAEVPLSDCLVSSDFELESATWRELTAHHAPVAEPEPLRDLATDSHTVPLEREEGEIGADDDEGDESPDLEDGLTAPHSPVSESLSALPTVEDAEPVAVETTEAADSSIGEAGSLPTTTQVEELDADASIPEAIAVPEEAPEDEGTILPPPGVPVIVPPPAELRTPLAGVSEWPSAKVILEQYRRDKPATPAAPHTSPVRATRPLPQPTVEYAPRSVSIPGRVSVGLAAAVALLVGTGMLALSWSWSQDDRLAGMLANQLVRPGHELRRVAVPDTPPSQAWWRSTANHMYLHSLARNIGNAGDSASAEEIHALLDAARSASPLHRQVRLARIDAADPGVGLSRDVLALRLTGKRLLREGKVEAALRVYQNALQRVDQVDLATSPVPAFDDAMDVRRFQLPGESLLIPMFGDLAAAEIPAETRSRWFDALPRRAVLGLSLFRFHQARGEMEAAAQAARIAQDAEPPARPAARALHIAAQAEVLALQGRWQEAADRYNEAIAAIPEGTVRRTWAVNLGELEARLEHDDLARNAWAIARGDDPDDAINLRLVEARRRRGHLEPPTLLVTPSTTPDQPDQAIQRAEFTTPSPARPR